MKKQQGIILKRYKNTQTFSLLDKHEGKIKAVVFNPRLSQTLQAGSFIMYYMSMNRFSTKLESVEVMYVPLLPARKDIFFLHHILELCYYFLPMASHAEHIFNLLYVSLYGKKDFLAERLHKKIILWKLFVLLGMFPEEKELDQRFFYFFMEKSVEEIAQMNIDDRMIKIFDQWLSECIASHPHNANFKTVDLFKDNGVL